MQKVTQWRKVAQEKRNRSTMKIAAVQANQVGALLCPRCGFHCLHHGRVTIFERQREDSDDLVMTVVDRSGTATSVADARSDNPSDRRHGLAIAFECEGCGEGIELTIAQHKGETHLAWRLSP
ncbi:hypothetical protein RHODGE_RHODGE_01013 [Rhodoplanes serenus]|uniref:Uncharacterized protein n=1 Tax=Rhodoplanes serenus TaxID=200615 RepID=A0A3S4F6C0_9BRAD|nr:hypothetical protein [Rhodoplanes serenus]VCU06595.1 hypothetical protein RHODPL_RHODPL_00043 [Rhodoplanes serenus]VCU07863.1 hypothetical protein RHODGE_RHODGE_01013 [Rhodoplanes serenus]